MLHTALTSLCYILLHIAIYCLIALQVCGVYLSFFFMLSHNFVEARTFEHSKGLDGGEVEYLAAVLQTTSNVGGKVSALCMHAPLTALINFFKSS
jgi:hypothetical protein